MSRHSRGDGAVASRRSRRRVEEPSITEWLDSGSYGPYAADANRGLPEEPVSAELPPPYEPPPAYEAPYGTVSGTSYSGADYGSAAAPSSYETGSYNTPSSYETGSYSGSSYGTASASPSSYSGYSYDTGYGSSYGTESAEP